MSASDVQRRIGIFGVSWNASWSGQDYMRFQRIVQWRVEPCSLEQALAHLEIGGAIVIAERGPRGGWPHAWWVSRYQSGLDGGNGVTSVTNVTRFRRHLTLHLATVLGK